MPIEISKLYPNKKDEIIFDYFRILYERKMSLFLFAAIAIRPNIAFATFCFFRFYQKPESQFYEAANQVFYYLFLIQDYFICYEGET